LSSITIDFSWVRSNFQAVLDAGLGQDFAGRFVFLLAAAPGGIEHDAHLDVPAMGVEDSLDEAGIGKQEHLDAERAGGCVDGVDDRLSSVIGEDNYGAGHAGFLQKVRLVWLYRLRMAVTRERVLAGYESIATRMLVTSDECGRLRGMTHR
jgi:hypothetical protein